MAEDGSWERMIHGLRKGDERVFREFWEEYGPQLHRVAERHLADGLRRRLGPEDVVQSACRTFFRRAQGGEFRLADSESLWRLLCAITLTKVREQTRYHMRQKRGLDREVAVAAPSDSSSAAGPTPAEPGPTPAEAAEFTDQFRRVLDSFDEEERQVVDLKLQEYTNEEVAEHLGCSERTVRRILKRLQTSIGRAFDVS